MVNIEPKNIIGVHLGKSGATLFTKLIKQKPKNVDAIIFIQGDRLDRAPTVKSLYKKGFAKQIIITGNNNFIGQGKRNEENDIHLSKLEKYLLTHGIPKGVITIDDQAFNTLDQAVNTIKLAKRNSWSSLIIVTSSYNLLRTYLTFAKQAKKQKWQGTIIMQLADLPWSTIPSGRKRTAIVLLSLELEKIKKYKLIK